MTAKRLFDLALTLTALIMLFPVMLIIGIWIKRNDPGNVFFCQERIGRYDTPFTLYKFRTMYENRKNNGDKITVHNDPRITPSGRFLRKTKLDELPQLFNVLIGDMSLVGPRPEVAEFVEHWPREDRDIVLSVRPGLTDYAAIYFMDEEVLLRNSDDPKKTYIEQIIPQKIALYKKYVRNSSLKTDIHLILKTLQKIFIRQSLSS